MVVRLPPDISIIDAQEVSAASHWHGWGRDDSLVCPQQNQTFTHNTSDTVVGNAHLQPWTGVTCSPQGQIEQLNLTGLNLTGNASLLSLLAPLQYMQLLSLADNNLAGWIT